MRVKYRVVYEFEREVNPKDYLPDAERYNSATLPSRVAEVTLDDIAKLDKEYIRTGSEWIEFMPEVGVPEVTMEVVGGRLDEP